MKKLILTCLCAILLHAQPLYSVPVVVDFEGLTGMNYTSGNPIPGPSQLYNQLSSLDILFTSGNPYVAVVELGSPHATSGKNGIGGSTPEGGLLTYSQSITVSFFDDGNTSAPLTTYFVSIRGDNYTTSGFPVHLYAYDLNGNFITSDTKDDTGGVGVALMLTVLAPGIHSVQFFGTDGGWGSVAFDDLRFNTPVPEPATMALLGLGALSLLRSSRRRREP